MIGFIYQKRHSKPSQYEYVFFHLDKNLENDDYFRLRY
jgi:hypothetical protein